MLDLGSCPTARCPDPDDPDAVDELMEDCDELLGADAVFLAKGWQRFVGAHALVAMAVGGGMLVAELGHVVRLISAMI